MERQDMGTDKWISLIACLSGDVEKGILISSEADDMGISQ